MQGGAAGSRCPALPGRGDRAAFGIWGGGPPNPSRQLRTHGAGSAAGRRGVRGRRLHSPAEAGKGGGSAGAPTRALAAPPGRRPCPRGSPAELDGAGSPSRRAWGAQREAACRPRRLAPVPTSLVSHGWSEVLFLKRLQGGLKQPPTSLPEPRWTVSLARGRGPGRCTWRLEGWDLRAGGRGRPVPPPPSQRPGARLSSRGLEAQGRKVGECRCPATVSAG